MPEAGFITLNKAVTMVGDRTAQVDVSRAVKLLRDRYAAKEGSRPPPTGGPYSEVNERFLYGWLRQQEAYSKVNDAVAKGKITLYANDPSIGMTNIDPSEWLSAAFRDQMLRSSVFRTSACESLERYDGQMIYVEDKAVRRWLAAESLRRPAADERACQAWLLEQMLANPKKRTNRELQAEATELFGVSVRAFKRAKAAAIRLSKSDWNKPGRPKKSKDDWRQFGGISS